MKKFFDFVGQGTPRRGHLEKFPFHHTNEDLRHARAARVTHFGSFEMGRGDWKFC